ncbi:MAG TPA: nucleotidyltransferase domain-containing protein [Candidatus Lokiarchaeia archaeon]|nr:nucleotidyltransferase domain-containing protein [Candidatus Lokiarchaeia archaeon]
MNKKNALIERKQFLIQRAGRCAEILKDEFLVTEVYLIGSLARPGPIHEQTDIDLVEAGLADNLYFKALNRLYEIAKDDQGKEVNIDLIALEDATDRMKEIVSSMGVKL